MTEDPQKQTSRRTVLYSVAGLSGLVAAVKTPIGRAIVGDGQEKGRFPAWPGFVSSVFQDNPAERRYVNEITAFSPEGNVDELQVAVAARLKRVEPEENLVLNERIGFELGPGESETESIEVEDLAPGEYHAETESGGMIHEDSFVVPGQAEEEEQGEEEREDAEDREGEEERDNQDGGNGGGDGHDQV